MSRALLRLAAAIAIASAFVTPSKAQLPNLGGVVGNVLGHTRDTLGAVGNGLGDTVQQTTGDLRQVRVTQLDALRHRYPNLIDVDPFGAEIIRGRVLAVAPTAEALNAARAQGYAVADTEDNGALGVPVVVLSPPANVSTREAVEALRRLDPRGSYDYDHLYASGGDTDRSAATPASRTTPASRSAARIGLVDGGVDASHPALAELDIHQRTFAGQPKADPHGTAVASLIAGDGGGFHGAAPGASLYVADVYGGAPTGGGASAIVAALNWLASERTPVVNISLVGPPNRALEAAVHALAGRGVAVVAAVGNDGPSAPPLYPASYPGVIGVSGVDARNRVLPEAGRGAQVTFAAPGADMAAATPGGGFAAVRGTSFAAPIVAGLIAREGQARVEREAVDLGARGRDPVYGLGMVGAEVRTSPRHLATQVAGGVQPR